MTQAPPVPDGRKLLRLEVRNAETPIERKPEWIKTRAKMGPQYTELQSLVKSEGLHTVCQEAGCPNIFECWEDREATFLIGGDQCTRRCDFCQIDTGKPQPLDRDEPRRVAESVQTMGLRYATITGVARDDLPDGGAWLYAETVRAIHELTADMEGGATGVENLVPDFNGRPDLLAEVFESRPEVLAHNLETVPRIFKRIRPAFRYDRSLAVLTAARDFGLVTKSNLILGMGETRDEVSQALRDLHAAGCELVTITQYLRPSVRHHPVERWVRPEEFVELAAEAHASKGPTDSPHAAAHRVAERRRAAHLARHYRDQEGLSIAEIARRLGRAEATIKAYLYDPTGEKARAVKARYRGVCRGCGAPTAPRNGKGDAYAYCKRCHPGAIAPQWTRERVREAMRAWRARYGAAPSSYDWSRTHARRRGGEALKRLQAAEWPAPSTVTDLYGSWAAARADAFAGA